MSVLKVLIWLIAGIALMGLIVWFTLPLLMLVMHRSRLSFDETVTSSEMMGTAGKDLSEVVNSVTSR